MSSTSCGDQQEMYATAISSILSPADASFFGGGGGSGAETVTNFCEEGTAAHGITKGTVEADLPATLIDDFSHWLSVDEKSGSIVIEFIPLEKSRASSASSSGFCSDAEFVYRGDTKEIAHCASGRRFLDINSETVRILGEKIFRRLELINMMQVFAGPSVHQRSDERKDSDADALVVVKLPRLQDLTFQVLPLRHDAGTFGDARQAPLRDRLRKHLLEEHLDRVNLVYSPDKALYVSPQQEFGTLLGLQQGLLLCATPRDAAGLRSRRVLLLPHAAATRDAKGATVMA
ncbi:unnamed protein product, partial [Amoebophrya sp. A120]|eukprot:GSA120T00003386001.1